MREELRELNKKSTERYLDDLEPLPVKGAATMDGSLKKNSAMVNRLKAIQEDSSSKLIDDLNKLRFEKFVEDMTASITEASLKIKTDGDLQGLMRVCSLFHQRSREFLPKYLQSILKHILPYSPKAAAATAASSDKTQEKTELAKQNVLKTALRILSELVLYGLAEPSHFTGKNNVFPGQMPPGSAKFVGETTFKDVLGTEGGFICYIMFLYLRHDKDKTNGFLATHFASNYAKEFVGVKLAEGYQPLVPELVRTLLQSLFKDYFTATTDALQEEWKKLNKMKRYNEDYQVMRGELSDQQKTRSEDQKSLVARLKGLSISLSESLGFEMPDLSKLEQDEAEKTVAIHLDKGIGQDKDYSRTQWEDEETRNFYRDVGDLGNLVPKSLLVVSEKKKKKRNKKKQEGDDEDVFEEEFYDYVDDDVLDNLEKLAKVEDEQEAAGVQPAPKTQASKALAAVGAVENILLTLPNMINKALLDKAVLDFCSAQQNCQEKARASLTAALLDVPRFRLDILPYYARFIAWIHPYMPEVGNTVMAALILEFKRRFRKQHAIDTQHRIKNVRYLGELAKFGICPTHIMFYCFKRLIQPEASGSIFSANHVTVACQLLECAGRFMNKHPEAGHKWAPLMEVMKRKCKTAYLEPHVLLMVENAFLAANPPEETERAITEKKRTPLEHYIRKIVLRDASHRNVDKVLKLLRALPWGKPVKMKVWDQAKFEKSKISSPKADAEPIAEAPGSVDVDVTEQVQEEVEVNVFQILLKLFSRIWKLKFSNVIVMADLASGLSYFHNDWGVQLVAAVLEQIRIGMEDMSHYRFNQRRLLVVRYLGELYNFRCTTSDVLFDTLYSFITFGHRNGKPHPDEEPPCLVDGKMDYFRIRMICELLDTSGQFFSKGSARKSMDQFLVYFQYYILTKDQDAIPLEIGFAIDDTIDRLRPGMKRVKSFEEAEKMVVEVERILISTGSPEDAQELREDFPVVAPVEDAADSEDSSDSESEVSESESEEEIEVKDSVFEVPTEEEVQTFDKELQSLLSESIQSRRNEKRNVLDVSIPMNMKQAAEAPKTENVIKFAVLTRGGKQQTALEVPYNSELAQNTLTKQGLKKKEENELKKITLAMHAKQ